MADTNLSPARVDLVLTTFTPSVSAIGGSRTMTTAMLSEVAKTYPDILIPIVLAKFSFDSGDLNLWSGYGDLPFGGDTYTGTGDLAKLTPIIETGSIKASGMEFHLSGLDSSIISLALTSEYQNRDCKVWLGFFDESKAIISDPVVIFLGRMDIMQINEDVDGTNITLSAENVLVTLERANERRYTKEDQILDYPDDKGLDFVTTLQDQEVVWGGPDPRT